jgi:uncharacterized membrane protein YtjA (UPF0391 family)
MMTVGNNVIDANKNGPLNGDPIMHTKSCAEKKLRWDVIFLFNALAAALYSLFEITPVAAGVAKGLCYTFLVFFMLSLLKLCLHKAVE